MTATEMLHSLEGDLPGLHSLKAELEVTLALVNNAMGSSRVSSSQGDDSWVPYGVGATPGETAKDAEYARKLQEEMKMEYEREQHESCNCCGKAITDGNIVFLENCCHIIAKACVERELSRDGVEAKCPQCHSPIGTASLRQVFGDSHIDQVERDTLATISIPLVDCVCGNKMEVVQGDVMANLNLKDEAGNPLTREAAEHMAKYRLRCAKCDRVFCIKCNADPYHIGKTCEEYMKYKAAIKCRFCDTPISKRIWPEPAFQDVCNQPECVGKMKSSCTKIHTSCGHPCGGFRDEEECLPCLHEECASKDPSLKDQNCESYCVICYCEGLGSGPCIRNRCGHIVHFSCLKTKVEKRWPGPRITFGFLTCPACKAWIDIPPSSMSDDLIKDFQLLNDIRGKAVKRLDFEGMKKDEKLTDPASIYYGKPDEYAMASLAYYLCFKCKKPYFGGKKQCINIQEEAKDGGGFNPEELVCASCSSDGSQILDCKKHGKDFIEFKCRFCCSIAQWFCWGSTHFCDSCHARQNNGDYVSRKKKSELPVCKGPASCPLKVKHKPNGDEFSIGCAVCRNNVENVKDF
eukprot:CAMPEP_0115008332 /NCGR_PEP_ID=MMETSP0216-20121206/21845_1 /TAXON_ID=223996 /ORGANISM="Protocruzia adherens, Strain Boccale" /LENGTH=575 /DNA_ID=CAMNT_0002375711 /DNA_START=183 /DNA_END=1910 /DNA_ORIENTATION=+